MPNSKWDRPEDRIEVGQRLRWLELALGLNGQDIAAELGTPVTTWATWKAGETRLPTGLAAELKRRYGCSMDWLYLGDEAANLPVFTAKLRAAEKKGPPPRRIGAGRKPQSDSSDTN
jgi:transcriptional regulator with XRE-family HTH domain